MAEPRLINRDEPVLASERGSRSNRKAVLAIGVAAVGARLPRGVVDPLGRGSGAGRRGGQVSERERADGIDAVRLVSSSTAGVSNY